MLMLACYFQGEPIASGMVLFSINIVVKYTRKDALQIESLKK
jgi:hypothetical protein